MKNPPLNRKGFTLLELIISITILALLALMISRIFSESSRAVSHGRDQSMIDDTARMVLDVLEQDISQALIRTNVTFRVHEVDGNDALYFISTAAQRHLRGFLRSTAPIRIEAPANDTNNLNRVLNWVLPTGSIGDEQEQREKLMQLSDYYLSPHQSPSDFEPAHSPAETMPTQTVAYTLPAEDPEQGLAVLTFMDIHINGVSGSSTAGSKEPPRFVDVIIGLIPASQINRAQQLAEAGNTERAAETFDRQETVYARRIFLRNQGIDQLQL